MAKINRFEELKMWQLAREINKDIHLLIKKSPEFSRNFSLFDQMRRSSERFMENSL